MNLFLDIISPIPEFSVIHHNKIILSRKIVKFKEDKLSDNIILSYQKIDKKIELTKNLNSLTVTIGPGSYTSLRVGISFMLGLHYSKKIKISGISVKDILDFQINSQQYKNYGIYIISGNKQKFVCYKLKNKKFKYIKLENNSIYQYDNLREIDILYYNHEPINLSEVNCKQIKCIITENILKNLIKLKFNNTDILKPIYISNNKTLN